MALRRNTVKIGVMDEERRTTVNLKECIRAARHRIAFINTGFLDRTGDEIHTSMEAGPMVRKADMRAARWIKAYEDWNVDTGLACGLRGTGADRQGHVGRAGRTWRRCSSRRSGIHGPAPTAPGFRRRPRPRCTPRTTTASTCRRGRPSSPAGRRARRSMTCSRSRSPTRPSWSADERRAELDNNAQGILGYVVRWVDQGIGCSKVPDINNVALMEDRATCRISSQHIANWLRHGIVTAPTRSTRACGGWRRSSTQQNAGDPDYQPMAPAFDGEAFLAARALVFEGTTQPSGYTEPILHGSSGPAARHSIGATA